LFSMMRGSAVLEHFAGIRGNPPQLGRRLAERLDLDLSRRVAFMSTGMRQKLGLAIALSAETPVTILDEPTSGLDPNVQAEVMRIVREARAAGRTLLFSSHILSEVEEVCERVVIMRAGRLVHTQVMTDLRSRHRIVGRTLRPLTDLPPELASGVDVVPVNGATDDDEQVVIEVRDDLLPVLRWLSENALSDIRVEPIGLKSVYTKFHAEAAVHA
jgi:ABC-2 type transport system ATP-binding protein